MNAQETWNELVTTGLLGTDRRDPPALDDGPVADVVADALRPTPAGRLLAAVAATAVARRCGGRPLPARPPLMPPPADDRPPLPLAAARRWRQLVVDWPVLEAEWLAVAAAAGWRPAPDILVALLRRHQRTPVVAGAVVRWGQPLSAWLLEQLPALAPWTARAPEPPAAARALPVPAEFEPLLAGPPEALTGALVAGLREGSFRWSHRAVLHNVVVRVPAPWLAGVVDALAGARDRHEDGEHALFESLLELASFRGEMLAELERHDE